MVEHLSKVSIIIPREKATGMPTKDRMMICRSNYSTIQLALCTPKSAKTVVVFKDDNSSMITATSLHLLREACMDCWLK